MVKVEIKRTGFPVEIGDIELWFDSSVENLKNFANLEKVSREKLDEVSEKAQHVHFPKEINDETINEVTEETIEETIEEMITEETEETDLKDQDLKELKTEETNNI